MKLDLYISQLLYQYDCVIVPDFGGFVGNFKSANIQVIQNTFNPPCKQISFNKNLKSNDGLLANLIAKEEKISYNTACDKIGNWVAEATKNLNNHKKIQLSDIGVLFLNEAKTIQFEPSFEANFLLEAYGLSSFQKKPIQRVSVEEKISKEFKARTAPLKVVKNNNTKKWLVAAAITIPLTFFAIWIPAKYDLNTHFNYANFNPFNLQEKTIYIQRKSFPRFKKDKNNESIKSAIANAINQDENYLSYDVDNNHHSIVIQLKEKVIEKAVSTYVNNTSQHLSYHIIGGCFSDKNNAKRMVKSLKKQGFNATILGKRKGLWTVSFNSFSTRNEAVKALAKAKSNNPKAWVLNESF